MSGSIFRSSRKHDLQYTTVCYYKLPDKNNLAYVYKVKPVLRAYIWDKEKVAFKDR